MPPLTTGFMRAYDSNIWSSGVDQGLSRMNVDNVLAMILLADTTVLARVGFGEAKDADNIEIRWLEDQLNPQVFTAAHTYTDDDGDALSITVPTTLAEVKRIIRAGAIIKPIDTDFFYQVDAAPTGADPSSTTITAYNSKGKGSSVTSTTWKVVALPAVEGADASADISRPRTLEKNWLEIKERAIQITDTRKNMAMYAVSDEFKHQSMARLMEIKRELDVSVLYGQGIGQADDNQRTFKGINELIRNKTGDNIISASGVLTMDIINNAMEVIYDAGGADAKSNFILAVASKQQRVISKFNEDIIRTERSDRQAGTYVKFLLTEINGKEIEVVVDRNCDDSDAFLVDLSRVGMRHMKNDQFHIEKLARTGRTDTHQLSGQYSLMLKNAGEAHSLIHTIS